eukprot:TRINITY_DN4671_c0_g1_i2.p1 TRINITY_DN4671_c0_g1~~TRINITY_DN4671_c0_g1_i2.p1  ORF type:complete len:599 (-),score=177.25 TRINITY_DN4671_c0_g1_i2:33-1829(-)
MEEVSQESAKWKANSSTVEIDRSSWISRLHERHPQIVELKERLYPLERGISLGREYQSSDPVSRTLQQEDLLNPKTVMQLIMQYLEFEGLKKSKALLERELKMKCTVSSDRVECRLVTILRMILKDTERIYDFAMDDKFTTSKQNFRDLQDHLLDLDLLEEDELDGDVSIWEENPFNLITDPGPPITIKGASFNNLVIKLTDTSTGETFDPQLLPIMLATYRTFTTPEKFLQKLIERFQVPPKPMNGESEEEWKSMKKGVQLKVIGVLKRWIPDQYDDFRNSDKLMKRLEEFMKMIQSDPLNQHLAKALQSTLSMTEKLAGPKLRTTQDINTKPSAPDPRVSLKTIFAAELDVLRDIDEEEIARQLTLLEFEIYAAIKHTELLGLAWSKPNLKHRAPNVLRMSDRSTKLSQWVATMVLKEEKIKKRVRLIQKLIKIAEYLFQNNNFSTTLAILAGLNTSPIHRLRFTWAEVSRGSILVFHDLQDKLSSNRNFSQYRAILAAANPPCIPYLGTYLTDLTFIDEANDQYRELINFSKRKSIYDVFEKIKRYQLLAYNFIPIEQIQARLQTRNLPRVENEDERFKLSFLREPRDAERSDIL